MQLSLEWTQLHLEIREHRDDTLTAACWPPYPATAVPLGVGGLVKAPSTRPLPESWPSEGCQDLVTISNNHTTCACIRQIDHDVSAHAGCGRKNDTLDTFGNPNGSELLRGRILGAAETACHDLDRKSVV